MKSLKEQYKNRIIHFSSQLIINIHSENEIFNVLRELRKFYCNNVKTKDKNYRRLLQYKYWKVAVYKGYNHSISFKPYFLYKRSLVETVLTHSFRRSFYRELSMIGKGVHIKKTIFVEDFRFIAKLLS